MRNKYTIYKGLLTLVLVAVAYLANAGNPVYTKEFNKSYQVSSDATMDLETSFGDITITTWDQNTIDIHVEVKVEAKSEEKANKLFDKIDVKIIEQSNHIKLKTNVNNMDSGDNEWSIDVVIKMPRTGNLDADHSFGSLEINELSGKCDVDLSYGEFKADVLSNNNNNIKVAFGDGEIGQAGGGEMKVEFGNFDIDRVMGNSEISCSYGDLDVDFVSKKCSELVIHNDFGSVDITLEAGSNYDVKANASFGDVDLPSSAKIISEDEDFTSISLKARIGDGANPGELEINCSFGDAEIDID